MQRLIQASQGGSGGPVCSLPCKFEKVRIDLVGAGRWVVPGAAVFEDLAQE